MTKKQARRFIARKSTELARNEIFIYRGIYGYRIRTYKIHTRAYRDALEAVNTINA